VGQGIPVCARNRNQEVKGVKELGFGATLEFNNMVDQTQLEGPRLRVGARAKRLTAEFTPTHNNS